MPITHPATNSTVTLFQDRNLPVQSMRPLRLLHRRPQRHCCGVTVERAPQLRTTPEMKGPECRKLTARFHSTDLASLVLPDACRVSSHRLPISLVRQLLSPRGCRLVDAKRRF